MTRGFDDELIRELRAAIRPTSAMTSERPVATLTPVRMHPLDMRRPVTPPHEISSRTSFVSLTPWLVGAGLVVAALIAVSQYGMHLKSQVIPSRRISVRRFVSVMPATSNVGSFSARVSSNPASDNSSNGRCSRVAASRW